MALRVSGQLMLGVVRIYGRKVQYLMDDCRETRERISMTFRPGAVDLPQDQVRASRGAITFEAAGFDALDMFDWGTFDVPVAESRGLHTAPLTQTNLRGREYGAFNFGRPKAASIFGDSSRAGSVDDSTQHLDSQDFQPIDLDLGLDDFSMEFGRDALSERSRSKSALRTPSVINDGMEVDQPFDAGDTFEPLDLGLDFGDLPELEDEPVAETEERRRASSELSTPPPEAETLDLTPRVAKRLADAKAAPRAKRVRIVRADEELELADDEFAPPADDSPMLGEENFIPANPAALRLRDILDDPIAHFLPTVGARLFAGPPGLAPELAELFTFPANVLRRAREEPVTPPRPAKRARKEASPEAEEEAQAGAPAKEQEEDVEVARRDSRQASVYGGDGGDGFDSFEPVLDLDMGDIPDIERRSTREPSIALPRADSAPLADGTHPLAAFDTRTLSSQATQSDTESAEGAGAGGFSRNTALAMGVLRRELDAIEAEAADKKVSYTTLAQGASKRAASAMFFELLVLGTRDAVVLKQDKAFGAIEVAPKERLYALAA